MNDVGVDRHSEDRLTTTRRVIGLAITAVPLAVFAGALADHENERGSGQITSRYCMVPMPTMAG